MKTKQERRIAVLKDALKQLKAQKIIATAGEVCEATGEFQDCLDESLSREDAQKLIKKYLKGQIQGTCNVCARGALLVSTINKENSFKIAELKSVGGSFTSESSIDKRLMRLFSKRQLCLMENAFEVYSDDNEHTPKGINSDKLSNKDADKSYEFGEQYTDDNDRLEAILTNAIKNKGLFTT